MIPRFKPIRLKRLKQIEKDRGSNKTKKWRDAVLKRDDNRCQFPGCNQKDNLQIHHIRRYADAAHLRYEVFNGITLCEKCHRRITGNEGAYEFMFLQITIAKAKKNNDKNSV